MCNITPSELFSANEECTRYPLILLAFYTKTGNLRSRLQKIDMMLEILEISLICQNVKKQSIFKKKFHQHHFLFFRRYSVHCTISMAKISYRPHVTPFFSPIQEEDFPAPLGGQSENH